MRLIDADALAKFIDYGHLNSPDAKVYSENDIREMIDMMPTIDKKVEVVRCKECRYKDMEICPMYRLVVAGVRKCDDFCSYGERSER